MIKSPNNLYSENIKAIILSEITEIVHFILLPYVSLEKSILIMKRPYFLWRELNFFLKIVFEVYINYPGSYKKGIYLFIIIIIIILFWLTPWSWK